MAMIVSFAIVSCGALASAAQDASAPAAAHHGSLSSAPASDGRVHASDVHTVEVHTVEVHVAETGAARGQEHEASIEVFVEPFVEPFDRATWERRLAFVDLDRRERAFERLEAILPRSPDAQAWVRAEAQRNEGELAWTCRMLLRAQSPESAGSAELFVWRGNDDRVLLGGPPRSLHVDGVPLDLVIVESLHGEPRRFEAEARRARRVGTPVDFVPLPPGAAPTELRFEIAITGRDEDGAPFTAWRVLDESSGGVHVLERALPAVLDRSSSGATIEVERGAHAGGFILERRSPRSAADGGERPARTTMDRLGVFVDVEGEGLVVLDVEPGSVAHALGVARGDRLSAIDGIELVRPEDITARLRLAAPQGSVSVRWRRGGDGLVIERRYVAPRVALEPSTPSVEAAPPAPPVPSKD